MVDRLAEIKCVEMPIEMQEEAVRTANEALDSYSEDYEIAAYLRQRFDKLYKPVWHCFVGRSFGGSVAYEEHHFIYFTLRKRAFMLYKWS
ncbi:hypothetical protein CRM22_000335 [Opisthorchis felineus]|uniref:Dynein light chain n=1 Tax=Opisthorchis felineus TaxID=147828 RepID=A0A4S2MFS4_OPIFE|nr:hypothetical protein CRM22_000335 [Opisthorchis felineus]